MSNTLREIEKLYNRLRCFILVLVALLIAALFTLFINRTLFLALLAAAVIYYLGLIRPMQKHYANARTEANLMQTVCKVLGTDQVSEKENRYINVSTLSRANLMPCGNDRSNPLICWEIHGEKKKLRITLCDVTIPQSFSTIAGDKKRFHFSSGVWAHIELPSVSQLDLKLLDESSVPEAIRTEYFSGKPNYEEAPVEGSDIGKHFIMYRIKGSEQQPPAAMQKKLKALADYTPGYVALSINENQMDLFIRGRFLARTIPVSQKPTEQLLNFDPLPELSYIIDLALSAML